METTLIIPALNPDERLLNLVKELRVLRPDMQILVVDDGSNSTSALIFDQLKFLHDCIICRHLENYGKGAAIKTGIGYLLRHCPNGTGFLTADADGQHRAVDILRVARAMERYPARLIMGTRDFSGRQVPFKNRWGNRITSTVFHQATGMICPDTQTGLRGIPAVYGHFALDVPGERFEYEMNFLLHAAGMSVPLLFETIETVYLDRNSSSHFRPVRDALKIYGAIGKYVIFTLFHRRKHERKGRSQPLSKQKAAV